MKIKNSLIPFIPITLLMIACKLASLFGLDSDGLFWGMSGMTLTYIVIGITLFLFVVCFVINIFDRKTAQVYAVKKNPITGILAILSGVSVVASSIFGVVSNQSETEYYVMTLITAALSIPTAIALIAMSKVHFSGKSTVSSISLLYVFPSLWGCAELVTEFMNSTKVSISATDMTALFCYVFLTLYLFSYSMIVSKIKGRHPVKACFIYGLPAAAVSITFGIYEILYASRAVENLGLSTILVGAEFLILGLYATSFLFEMSRNYLTKDEVEILDSMPDDNDPKEESYASVANYDDELVISHSDNVNDSKGDQISDYVPSAEDISDFIMGYDAQEDDEPIPYFTKEEMEKSADFTNIFVTPNAYDEPEELIKQEKVNTTVNSMKSEKTPESSIQYTQNEEKSTEENLAEENLAEENPVNFVEENVQEVKVPEIPSNEKVTPLDSNESEIDRILSENKSNRTETVSDEKEMSESDKKAKQMDDIDALLKSLDDLK
ncbi:MAG: hypothetical protein J1E85_09505 [Ruminococcus sp.]|nr:hypothetical protein [Ruminococcus sp.]